MCDALTLLEDGIELEKYGEIYAAPKLNVFVLSCLRCQNPYMQLQDFLWHIQWEHAETTRATGDSAQEATTAVTAKGPESTAQPTPADGASEMQPVSKESNVPPQAVIFNENTVGEGDSVIAAKRITLSDFGDDNTASEVDKTTVSVAGKAEMTSDVVEMTVTVAEKTPESDEEAIDEVQVIDIQPEFIDITSDDEDIKPIVSESQAHMPDICHNLLPEPVTALNDAPTNAVNSEPYRPTAAVNDLPIQAKSGPRRRESQSTTKMKAAKAAPPYRPHSALKVRSLADIQKLLRERFKQQSREKKREEWPTCKCCKKLFYSREALQTHSQYCRDIS